MVHMTTDDFSIRKTAPGDAADIATLGFKTFSAAYGADNKPEDIGGSNPIGIDRIHVDADHQGNDIFLVYDKECPACDFYCKLVRIRESIGNLILVDARNASSFMDEITAAGLDIDQGMVLIVGARMYYGADAIHTLSIMGTRSGVFNRLAYWCFRSRAASSVVYPVLRSCRNLLLKILRKTKINNLALENNDYF
jgi:predicted DCC family thiol-disulfide oxidoreductase YuxK